MTVLQKYWFEKFILSKNSRNKIELNSRLKIANGREHNSLANLSNNDFVNNKPLLEDGANMRNFTQEYQYDEIGNIIQMKSGSVWTRDYRYNFANNNYLLDHDLQGTTDIYEYDTHGNMTKMPHLQELFWDYTDNLKEVSLDASSNKAYYVYDANGDRVRKIVVKNTGTIVEDRFYVGDYEIYSKNTNGTLDTERETLHLVDDKSKIALIDYDTQNTTTSIRYQYTNHLDSASLELDETGAIISYEEYHPFGTTSYRSGRSEAEVSLKRYKYVHKELDNETGLYYYGMRYYASWIARFISVDPLQFKYPIYTPYQYAGNKPISYIDLDGAEEKLANVQIQAMGADEYLKLQKSQTDANKRFAKSVLKVFRDVLVASSEIIGQMHYGDKVKEEDKKTTFPYTHNQDFLSLTVGFVTTPIIAVGEAVKDPSPENLGNAVGNLVLYIPVVKGFTTKKGGYTTKGGPEIIYSEGSSRVWAFVEGKEVGYYQFDFTGNVEFSLIIPDEFKGSGIGSKIFAEGIEGANSFTATWIRSKIYEKGISDNLAAYEAAIEKGFTKSEAAFQTWSGIRAKEYGFIDVEVKQIDNGIQAIFTKKD